MTRLIVTTLVRINTAGDSSRVRQMLLQDVDRTSMESFFRSIGDLRNTDLSDQLGRLSVPVLGVYGLHDNIVNPNRAGRVEPNGARFPGRHVGAVAPLSDAG